MSVPAVFNYLSTQGSPVTPSIYEEGASQTYVVGDWVTLSSGKLVSAAASGSGVAGATSLAGIALDPAIDAVSPLDITGAPKTSSVATPSAGVLFDLPAYSATGANAITELTQLGATFGLINVHNFSGLYAVNLDDTINIKVKVVDVQPTGQALGTKYGLLRVTVLNAQNQVLG